MPPKRQAAKKATQAVKDEIVPKKSARITKKRELSFEEEEPVDSKKKKVAAPQKRKTDKSNEPETSGETTTAAAKRKRTTATKSSKVNKDVNDNEVIDEHEEHNEDVPTQKTRGRVKRTAAATVQETAAVPIKKGRGRSTSKKTVTESTNEEVEDNTNQDDDNSKNDKEPAKRGRSKKATTKDEPTADAKEEPKKRGGRKVNAVDKDEHAEEATVESSQEPATKRGRGRSATTKKTATVQQDEELTQDEQPEPTSSQPSRRGRNKKEDKITENIQQEISEPVSSQEPPATKRGRKATTKQATQEEETKAESQSEQPVKRGRSKANVNKESDKILSQPLSQPEPATKRTKATRGGRKTAANKKEQDNDEQHNEEEILETQSQPEPVTRGKRSRRTKKASESDEVDAEIVKEAPAKKSTRAKKADDKLVEVASKEPVRRGRKSVAAIEVEKEEPKQQEIDEDIDEEEKELVIDLKEDEPKKPKGRKAKKADDKLIETVIEQPETRQPSKRGRQQKKDKVIEVVEEAAKSQDIELVSSTTNDSQREDAQPTKSKKQTANNKRKTNDEIESADNDQEAIEKNSNKETITSTEHDLDKRPVKRGRHAKEAVVDKKAVESEEEVVKEPEIMEEEEVNKEQQEKEVEPEPVNEVMEHDDEETEATHKEDEIVKQVEETNEAEEEKEEEDDDVNNRQEQASSSSSSQEEEINMRNDIFRVVEDIKSNVETSILEDSSLNETGEIISAKELEDYTTDSEDFKITYESVTLKTNFNETRTNELPCSSNSLSFTQDNEFASARKKIKLFNVDRILDIPRLNDGKVVVFGDDVAGELGLGGVGLEKSRPALLKIDDEISFVNTLSQHSACINNRGQLYTFGNNDEKALGRITADDPDPETLESTPTVCNLNEFKCYKVTTGDSHTAVLSKSGTVLYWGNFRDTNGSVGLTTNLLTASSNPIALSPEYEIVDIASGANFLLLLDSYGTVYSLGICDRGELGRLDKDECLFNKSNRSKYLDPHPIEFGKDVKIDKIWGGEFHAFARSTDKRIFGWGLNNYSQLGVQTADSDEHEDAANQTGLCVYKPREIPFFTELKHKIEKIACSQHHSIALDDQGRVYSFGRHEYGRLGLGSNVKQDAITPTLIESLKNKRIVDISCGGVSSFAVTDDGHLYSWGMQSNQLGHGDINEDIWEPRLVNSKLMDRFKALNVAAGSSHCLLLGHKRDSNGCVNNQEKNGIS